MAGHSKWANIKHQKAKADAKKGKIFSRIAKEIISAVKVGGSPDPKSNPRLRLALENARENNVPNEIIDRNIKKASNADQSNYDDVTYELYGHGGVGIIADVLTDNKNRMASELRIATNKRGGVIATPGAVAFNFDRKGVIQVLKTSTTEDALFFAATEAGAEDFEAEDDLFIVSTDPVDLYKVVENLKKHHIKVEEWTFTMIPKVDVECDAETAKANLALIGWLENIDDVDEVYHNMKMPE